jgi:hypothetical protein
MIELSDREVAAIIEGDSVALRLIENGLEKTRAKRHDVMRSLKAHTTEHQCL